MQYVYKRHASLVLFSISQIFCISCFTNAQSVPRTSEEPVIASSRMENRSKMNLILRVEKTRLAMDENLTVNVALHNVGDVPVFIHPDLKWGYSASLVLMVTDMNDRAIEPVFFEDSVKKPKLDNMAEPVLELFPNYFIGVEAQRPLRDLGLTRAGQYKVFLDYRSPLSEKVVHANPFWGKERGVLRSNILYIEVLPK